MRGVVFASYWTRRELNDDVYRVLTITGSPIYVYVIAMSSFVYSMQTM